MRRVGGPLLLACWMACVSSAKTDRFVWTNSPDPRAPFTNWTTAARTIQEAVEVCANGDTVVVTDGIYSVGSAIAPGLTLPNRICLTNDVVVRSVNGPAATVILGRGPPGVGAIRCAFLTNGATLSGFRLQSGATFTVGLLSEDRSGGGAYLSAGSILTNCHVLSSAAALRGGGIAGVAAVVANCEIKSNSAPNGGGAYLFGGALRDSFFRGNAATAGDGGGTWTRDATVSGCTFVSNLATLGGGLLVEGGTASNVVAVSNRATVGGGLTAAEAVVTEARLLHNSALDWGGGAYLQMSWLSHSIVSNNDLAWQQETNPLPGHGAGLVCEMSWVDHCDVVANRGNHAEDFGGGIACGGDAIMPSRIIACSIRDNSAGSGGGIYFFGPSESVIDAQTGTCEIRGNVASNYGGGICANTQAVVAALGAVLVADNAAAYGGGLAAKTAAQVTIEKANGFEPVFYDNTAADSGGGLYAAGTNAALTLRNVRVGVGNEYNAHGNQALGNVSARGVGGGGIALMDGASLTGCNLRVEFNQCPSASGGGILVFGAQAHLDSTPSGLPATAQPTSLFANNSAQFSGGAIYSFASQLTIQEASFFENAAANGGAIFMDSFSTGQLDNVVIAGNVAAVKGGGLHIFNEDPTPIVCNLRHCTVYANTSNGIDVAGASDLSLANCIVYSNVNAQIAPGYTVVHSAVQGGYAGVGNVDADPFFRDPAAFDFHLTLDSTGTVVDAGTDAGLTNDCVFRTRPLGAAPDPGAFEYNPIYDDTDGDGISDEWERVRGLDPRDAADGPAHGDADGRSNYEEYLADTDPLDGTNYFYLTDCGYNPARPDRGIFVGFTSSSNRLYDLYSVPVVSNGCAWTAMAGKTNYPGGGSYDGFNDTNAPSDGLARTYRVTVRPIPE